MSERLLHGNRCARCGDRLTAGLGQCYRCIEADGRRREHWKKALPTLASNLVTGAALCRARDLAYRNACNWIRGEEVLWMPGCNRTAP